MRLGFWLSSAAMWRTLVTMAALTLGVAACGRGVESSMTSDTGLSSSSSKAVAAVKADDGTALQSALRAGTDPNVQAEQGHPLLVVAIASGSRAAFELLLRSGADPGRPDANGQSAVHWAAMNESPWWLQTLLSHRADPNVPNARTQARPLMDAMLSHRDENLALLLKAGADPNARDSEGSTALHVAASTKRAGYSLQLLQAGADPMAQDNFGKTFQAYQWLGNEAQLPAERRQERTAVREWLKERQIAVQDPAAR
jgi:ankyrin repeat protein